MILLIVRDQNGQIFANASSLDIKWSSSDTKLARISQRSAANGRIKSNNTATGKEDIKMPLQNHERFSSHTYQYM